MSAADPGDLAAALSGRLGSFTLDVAFRASAGQVTALVGASGSGKSTILRALSGLERLKGEVRVGPAVWQSPTRFLAPHQRGVGYVFQHAALLPHLSVAENLGYARRRSGTSRAEFDSAVRLLGLEPLLDRAPERLSGGERQRVALCRALLTRPALLLLDEPLSGLDADAKSDLLPELGRVLAGLAIPIVYVSHDLSEVARLADQTLRLAAGRLTSETLTADDPLKGLGPDRIRALALTALQAGLQP